MRKLSVMNKKMREEVTMTTEEKTEQEEQASDVMKTLGLTKTEEPAETEEEETEETEETEEEETEEEESEEETEEEEEEETEEEETEEEDEDERDETIERLRKALADIGKAAPAAATPPVATPPVTPPPVKDTALEFVTQEELDEATQDSAKMNALLTKVVNVTRTSVEQNLRTNVTDQVQTRAATIARADEFFKENNDLLPFRKYVGVLVDEVQKEDSKLSLDELLSEAESRARKTLGIKKGVPRKDPDTPPKKKSKKKPAFPTKPKGPGKRGSDDRTALAKDVQNTLGLTSK
jgi:hypothetical protein